MTGDCHVWFGERLAGKFRRSTQHDTLVVVENKSESAQAKYEREIEIALEQETEILTPVSVIVHDIEFVNRRLRKAQYFFTDIKKEGVLLYDSGRYQLSEAKELLPAERKKLAQEDFQYWFYSSNRLLETFNFSIQKEYFSDAAFLLHQVTERLYSGILLVFTRYKPNTHDLAILRKLVNTLDHRFNAILPLDTVENRHLFKLLRKAYVDARYKPNYKITRDELLELFQQVQALKTLGEVLCQEKINSFVSS